MNNLLSKINRLGSDISFKNGDVIDITLEAKCTEETTVNKNVNNDVFFEDKMMIGKTYKITVKKYMTEPSTVSFDFQDKWNSGIPMPMVTMIGEIKKETRGMYFMELHGEAEATCNCLHCGRTLTNKISMLYGIGPVCGNNYGIEPFDTEEELNEAFSKLKEKIRDIKWSGWVIKSSIKSWEEV